MLETSRMSWFPTWEELMAHLRNGPKGSAGRWRRWEAGKKQNKSRIPDPNKQPWQEKLAFNRKKAGARPGRDWCYHRGRKRVPLCQGKEGEQRVPQPWSCWTSSGL